MNDEQNNVPLQDRIRLVRIQTFFDNAAGNHVSLVAAGCVFALLLRNEGCPENSLRVWVALLFLFCGLVFFFEQYTKKVGLSLDAADRLFRIRFILGCLVSALFGASVFLLPEEATRAAHALLFIITASIVAAGYMAYATEFLYCLMVNVLCFLPYLLFCIYRYLVGGETFYLLMSIASVLWQLFFAIKAFQVSRSIVGGIEVRERLHDETTERRLSEIALRESEDQSQQLASKLRLMCDNVPDMIWASDLEGRYTFVNKAFCETVLGVTHSEEPIGQTYEYFARRERDSHPDDPDWNTFGQHSMDVHKHTLSRSEPTIYEESGYLHGTFVFLDIHQARLTGIHGEVIGVVGCARDITERKASEEFVQHLAHYDVLTDLPNRTLLNDRLRQAIALARRDKGKLAVLFIDLDRLKPVNDTLGHDIGDLLLKEVARRLQDVVTREADTASRLGGDEFVVLLQRVNKERDAVVVAEKILNTLNQPFSICQHSISISACVGIAVYPQHGDEASQLLKNADAAMYDAKRAGRNGCRVFDKSIMRTSDTHG